MLRSTRHFLNIHGSQRRLPLIGLLAMGALGSVAEAVGVALVFPLIALINDPSVIHRSTVLSKIYTGFEVGSVQNFAIALGIAMAAVFVLKNLYMAWFYYLQASYSGSCRARLAGRLYRQYLNAPYVAHLKRNSSEIIRNIANLVEGPYSTFLVAIINLAADAFAVAGIVVVLLLIQPLATLAAAVVFILLFVLQNRIFGRAFMRLGNDVAELARRQQQFLQQSLGGIKETKIFGREDHFLSVFSRIQQNFADHMCQYQFINRLPPLITELALMCTLLSAIIGVLATAEKVTDLVAPLGLLAAAAFRLMPLFNRILGGINMIRNSDAGIAILATEIDQLNAYPKFDVAVTDRLPFRDSISLENVSFNYTEGGAGALHAVNIAIRKGEFIGLAGISGAGKTTLADIILGLLAPDVGRILVDGGDIAGDPRQWQANVGYVPQEVYVLDDTVRRNVAFGEEEGKIDDEKVISSLALVQLDDHVARLPHGLDTLVGERGVALSGGQRQRIGIARALYHDPEVLVLDEATSSLDTRTADEVMTAIQERRGGKTLIVIAHRIDTLRKCDRLIFLREGRIVDTGSFGELMSRDDEFARMASVAGGSVRL